MKRFGDFCPEQIVGPMKFVPGMVSSQFFASSNKGNVQLQHHKHAKVRITRAGPRNTLADANSYRAAVTNTRTEHMNIRKHAVKARTAA